MKNLKDIVYVGVDDTEIDLFEGQYKVPEGMSYNSYIVLDDKIAVMDAVDRSGIAQWLGNVDAALCGREPEAWSATQRCSRCSATSTAATFRTSWS